MIEACKGNKELFQNCDISYFRLITDNLFDPFLTKECQFFQKGSSIKYLRSDFLSLDPLCPL